MDKICIKDLQIYGFHGAFKEEQNMGQKFIISLELFLDLKEAGETDNLEKTINYAELCNEIEKEFNKNKYSLIERAAECIAEFVLLKYDLVHKVKVELKKPWAPIGKHLDYVCIELERKWHKAYIALGSNIGDKEKNLKTSIEAIDENKYIKVVNMSNFYETKPVGYLEQDDFLNAAIEIKTLLTPKKLIAFLLETELELKRERLIKWGPRTIDLDILLYDDLISSDKEIIIPHPRMQERLFVLNPLADIAPYVIHPLLNKRIIDLATDLKNKEEK